MSVWIETKKEMPPLDEEVLILYKDKKDELKEEIIRVANGYKGIIPDEVYNAVIAYEFSIENDKNYVA